MDRTSPDHCALHDPLEVARRLALDSPGGITALARKLGKNPMVLSHQLNPEQEGHNLALATAIAITELTHDNRIVEAWAALRGKVLIDMPRPSLGEEELLDQVLALDDTHGDFSKKLVEARKDGVIDSQEYDVLVNLLRRVMVKAADLTTGIGAQVRELPVGKRGGGHG